MTEPNNSPSVNPLGSFAGLVGVLSIFLYFIGWIYRWTYFGFFQVELTSLNLPADSFLLVPIQAILGNFSIFSRAVMITFITVILIKLSLWLIGSPQGSNSPSPKDKFIQKLHNFLPFQWLRSFARILPLPLRYEIIVVAWVLAGLFWAARSQGLHDAFRDAVNTTSTRPIITLVSPSDKIALGRNLDDPLTNPSLKGSRIIGDVEQFRQIYGRETNDTSNSQWRLLIENNNWAYIFPAMPANAKPDQRPLVLAINTGSGQVQLLILSR